MSVWLGQPEELITFHVTTITQKRAAGDGFLPVTELFDIRPNGVRGRVDIRNNDEIVTIPGTREDGLLRSPSETIAILDAMLNRARTYVTYGLPFTFTDGRAAVVVPAHLLDRVIDAAARAVDLDLEVAR